MKLSKKHIGKKFRCPYWVEGMFFKLLAVTSNGGLLGEDYSGMPVAYGRPFLTGWLEYKETKRAKK